MHLNEIDVIDRCGLSNPAVAQVAFGATRASVEIS